MAEENDIRTNVDVNVTETGAQSAVAAFRAMEAAQDNLAASAAKVAAAWNALGASAATTARQVTQGFSSYVNLGAYFKDVESDIRRVSSTFEGEAARIARASALIKQHFDAQAAIQRAQSGMSEMERGVGPYAGYLAQARSARELEEAQARVRAGYAADVQAVAAAEAGRVRLAATTRQGNQAELERIGTANLVRAAVREQTSTVQEVIAANTGLAASTNRITAETSMFAAANRRAGSAAREAGAAHRSMAGDVDLARLAASKAVVVFDELSRGQRGALMSTIGSTLRAVGGGAALVPLIAVGGTALVVEHLASTFGDLAEKNLNAAAAAGMSVERYSALARTMQLVDGDAQKAERTFGILGQSIERAVNEPGSRQSGAFAQWLGPGWQQQLQQMLEDPGQALDVLRQKFNELPPTLQRTEMARAALGRGFESLISILRLSDADFARFQQMARDSGSIMSDELAKRLAETGVATHRLGEEFAGLGQTIAGLTATHAFVDWMAGIVHSVREGIQSLADWMQKADQIEGRDYRIGPHGSHIPIQQAPSGHWEESEGPGPHGSRVTRRRWVPDEEFGPPEPVGPPTSPVSSIAGVPTEQLLALVQKLEGSASGSVSRAGARGIMQIMPGTAAQYGVPNPAMLSDDTTSRQVATRYLADLSQRYGGNLQAVLAAYNAGPGRADEWLSGKRRLPDETQRYLARAQDMQTNTALYSEQYDPSGLQREMQERLKVIEDEKQLELAKLKEREANARGDTAVGRQIEAERVATVEAFEKREAAIRDQYAGKSRQFNDPRMADRLADTAKLQAAEVDARTQQITRNQQLDAQDYAEYKASIERKIQEDHLFPQRVAADYDEWLSKVRSVYNQDQKEYDRVLKAKVAATQAATREQLQEQISAANATSAVYGIGARVVREASGMRADSRGAGRYTGAASELSYTQEAGQAETSLYQGIADRAGDDERVKREMYAKIAEVAERTGQEEMAIAKRVSDEMRRDAVESSKVFTQAFSSLGGTFDRVLDDVLTGRGRTAARDAARGLVSDLVHTLTGFASEQGAKWLAPLLNVQSTPGMGLSSVLGQGLGKLLNLGGSDLGGSVVTSATGLASQNFKTVVDQMQKLGVTVQLVTTANQAQAVSSQLVTTAQNAEAAASSAAGAASAAGGAGSAVGATGGLFSGIKTLFSWIPGLEGGGVIPSAAGGMVLDSRGGQLSILHPEEMVLPANLSRGIQAMIGSAGAARSSVSNATNLTYAPTINPGREIGTRAQFESFLRNHGTEMVNYASNLMRNGWRPGSHAFP